MLLAILAGSYIVMSVAALVAYAVDKRAAERGAWRIPEKVLHLVSLLGGWPGAFLAQKLFRHKTRKVYFQLTYWATVLVNCGALGLSLLALRAA